MRRYSWTVILWSAVMGVVGLAPAVRAQPTPENLCIQQVGEQYQALVKDQVMPGSTDLPWGQQLSAVASQVRQHLTQYEIKRNQADLAEKNIAQLLEQLRQAQTQLAALRKELEQAKGGSASDPTPKN
jgi:flagellar motility protein MotE (MotC chaperone)